MLFDLFSKKKDAGDRLFADRVYISSEAKKRACLQLAKDQPGIIFIAWFSHTAEDFKDFFKGNDVNERVITAAHLVNPAMVERQTPVFIEHYPLYTTELALVESWQLKNIPVYSAMDEPLFKHFGSDKMIPLIKLLGMKEVEAIEHSYVTESIIKGQQKIAASVSIEQVAVSQAEWMKINLPSI